jgi:hypothetical protein
MHRDEDLQTADIDRLIERRREERRAVEEAGGGVSEGFEQSEAELIDHAEHGSVSGALLGHAACPVLVLVRSDAQQVVGA